MMSLFRRFLIFTIAEIVAIDTLAFHAVATGRAQPTISFILSVIVVTIIPFVLFGLVNMRNYGPSKKET